MRLAVVGPQNTGKTTFIADFIQAFPHYQTPNLTYRDVVHQNKLKINQETTEESQLKIREFLFDQVKNFQGENVIFDRTVLDNYIYSLSQYHKGKIRKHIIDETFAMMHASLSHIDRLIFIPTAVGVELVTDNLRDTDKLYIDHINRLYLETLVDFARESPIPIWVIGGTREERVAEIRKKLYPPLS